MSRVVPSRLGTRHLLWLRAPGRLGGGLAGTAGSAPRGEGLGLGLGSVGRAWQCAPRIMAKDWSAEKYEEPSVSVTVCLPALIRSQSSSPLFF